MKPQRLEAASALEAMGFTALEARIYVDLLGAGAQSGYRVAQSIGKAAANTYRALETLEARGAVVCEDGERRLYRATPYAELTAMLSAEFARRAERAQNALASLEGKESDERIYRLTRPAQVYERARAMIERTREFLLIDAFPAALEELRSSIEAAASRGADVIVHAYAPQSMPGVRVIVAPRGAEVRARWPGAWLNVVADAAEALNAYVLDDQRTVGTWTQSAYLAWVLYCGSASETGLTHLAELAAREPQIPLANALRTLDDIVRTDPPGRGPLYEQLTKKKEATS
jgi:HTH-type transcriptional regulator, sugar sensing transcriptional regulator